jgi:hypothetical protein
MSNSHPNINQTNSRADEQSAGEFKSNERSLPHSPSPHKETDRFNFDLRVALADDVSPERLATLIEKMESGQQPDLYAAQVKCRKLIEEYCVTQLKLIGNVSRSLTAALERKDLTASEHLFLLRSQQQCRAERAKILAMAESVYPLRH